MAVSVEQWTGDKKATTTHRPTVFCRQTEASSPMRDLWRVLGVLAALVGVLTVSVGFDVVQD
jgi:hypothetical protein